MFDLTPILSAISSALVAVVAFGAAVLGVFVALASFKWLRDLLGVSSASSLGSAPIGEPPEIDWATYGAGATYDSSQVTYYDAGPAPWEVEEARASEVAELAADREADRQYMADTKPF